MASKYRTKWEPNSLNIEFWREVLLGRTIIDFAMDDHGMTSLTLDSGEVLTLVRSADGQPTIVIKDDL